MVGPRVQLLVTCLVDALRPEVGRATVAVLESLGCAVGYPAGQTCCGQPAFNVGMSEEAREMAVHTLDVLDATDGVIVVPSGSCADMIVHHYPEIFTGTDRAEQARRVASRIRELTQYLVDDLKADLIAFGSEPIAYHYSCHGLRGLGLEGQADVLLKGCPRAGLDGDRECCGFGGLFSIEMPAVSAAILEEKLDRVESSGAAVLVGGDVSCLVHMEGGLRRRGSGVRVEHIAQVLAASGVIGASGLGMEEE